MSAVEWLTKNNMPEGFNEHFEYWSLDEMMNVIQNSFQLYAINVPPHEKSRLVYRLKLLKRENDKKTDENVKKFDIELLEPQVSIPSPVLPETFQDSTRGSPIHIMTIGHSSQDSVVEQETTSSEAARRSSPRRRTEETNEADPESDETVSDDSSFGSLEEKNSEEDVNTIKQDTNEAWWQITNFIKSYDPNITLVVEEDTCIDMYYSKETSDGVLMEDIRVLSLFKSHKQFGECIIMTPTQKNQLHPIDRTERYADLKKNNWGFIKCSGRSNRKYYCCKGKTYSNINAILDFVMPY